jgi:ribosomal protein S18 acetylase RimI-like enzyme
MDINADIVEFHKVSDPSDINTVADLASKIWHEHYANIISRAQIDYMLDKFQSKDAIFDDIKLRNYEYLIFYHRGAPVGYAAFCREQNRIFVSKIYVLSSFRRNGIFRKFIKMLVDICIEEGLDGLYLTVNRNNETAVKAYKSTGFEVEREQLADIGGGFFMDDYVMFKPVLRPC